MPSLYHLFFWLSVKDRTLEYDGKMKSWAVNDMGVFQLEKEKDICGESIFRVLCGRKRTAQQMDRSMVR